MKDLHYLRPLLVIQILTRCPQLLHVSLILTMARLLRSLMRRTAVQAEVQVPE